MTYKHYHKINTVFKRDPATNFKTLLEGDYSLPEFEYLADCDWLLDEKVDGTNIRVMLPCKDESAIHDWTQVTFGGKTDAAQIPAFLYSKLEQLFRTDEQRAKLAEIFPEGGACLYGEGYGAKIQKGGGNYRPDQDFCLFDVKVGDWWLKRDDVTDIAWKLGLTLAPRVAVGTLRHMVELARKGFKSDFGDFQAEGIVARPKVDLFARNGERIITKIKTKDFRR